MSRCGPSLLERIQGLLERTYDIRAPVSDIGRFVIGDRGYRRLYANVYIHDVAVSTVEFQFFDEGTWIPIDVQGDGDERKGDVILRAGTGAEDDAAGGAYRALLGGGLDHRFVDIDGDGYNPVDPIIFDANSDGVYDPSDGDLVLPGFDAGVTCGPMINASAIESIDGLVKAAVGDGATAALGGAPIDGPGFFYEPTVLAVEGIFYGQNVRTTMILGHTRGTVLLAAAQAGLEVAEFPPALVKKTVVGAGGASKAQIGYMVQQLLKLKSPPTPNDAADGVAIALTYLLTRRQ